MPMLHALLAHATASSVARSALPGAPVARPDERGSSGRSKLRP